MSTNSTTWAWDTIMNHKQPSCQSLTSQNPLDLLLLAYFTLLLATSCQNIKGKGESYATIHFEPQWFKIQGSMAQRNNYQGVQAHPFFDPLLVKDEEDLKTNFYALNTTESSVRWGIHFPTGKRYFKQKLCPTKDPKNNFTLLASNYPYTEGIIPRVYNAQKKPQRIIVFGNKDLYKNFKANATHHVRIIGGVEQFRCTNKNCSNYQYKELIALAIDPSDSYFEKVYSLQQLKEKVNFKRIQSFMENAFGTSLYNTHETHFKIKNFHTAHITYKRIFTQKNIMNLERITQQRKTCAQLYEHTWNTLGTKITFFQQYYSNGNSYKQLSSVNKELSKNLLKDFRKFYKKNILNIKKCFNIISPTNIDLNYQRQLFFLTLKPIVLLPQINYFYSCKNQQWIHIPISNKITKAKKIENMFNQCTNYQWDDAFPTATNKLNDLLKTYNITYKFIGYDNGMWATHNKIYDWVFWDQVFPRCMDENTERIHMSQQLFPHDLVWKSPFPGRFVKGTNARQSISSH